MTVRPEDWPRVKAVFQEAVELADAEREGFLARACDGEPIVRAHVDRLLAAHAAAPAFLESPATAALGLTVVSERLPGRTIGHYLVESQVGGGSMGDVYKARDVRLGRTVALKVLPPHVAGNAERLRRFEAEGRAASSLNHPHIVVVHDFGTVDGRSFIATEFIEGETLRQRLQRGALPVRECVDIAVQVAGALAAAHARGIVHRDIKPENVMIRPDGYVKVLDFGVAKLLVSDATDPQSVLRTQAGVVIGTPRYMSPEQATGAAVDPRSDIFALGVLTYEMLVGRPPFSGDTPLQALQAVLHDDPPALVGSEAMTGIDRVLQRAMAKLPSDRYPSAPAFAADLRAAAALADERVVPRTRGRIRLIVLPFKMLRDDAEIGFLTFGLPDALSAALSGLPSVVVKSRLSAAGDVTDVRAIAAEAGVDLVLTGTLLPANGRLRVTVQLLDATATLLWSHDADGDLSDVFALQDSLAERILTALEVPLHVREHRATGRDVPANARAYEFFLRGNQLSYGARWWLDVGTWKLARDMYLACLAEDARFAPAWAALGRVYRVVAKFGAENVDDNFARAEDAFRRALELNPHLPLAHNLYAQLESDLGRSRDAMVRLLEHAQVRSNDPELFTALCHACRYCGLLDASVAAHERAVHLDPAVLTSVPHTYFVRRDYARVVEIAEKSFGGYGYIGLMSLAALGREGDALAAAEKMLKTAPPRMAAMVEAARQSITGTHEAKVAACDHVAQTFTDPEALFYMTLQYAALGETRRVVDTLERVTAGGYCCYRVLSRDERFAALRDDADFGGVLARLEQMDAGIVQAFSAAGGEGLLGVKAIAG